MTLPDVPSGHKACNRCRVVKPVVTGFHRDNRLKTGYRGICKVCKNASRRYYQRSMSEGQREHARQWQRANNRTERRMEYMRNYMKAYSKTDRHREYYRARRLKRREAEAKVDES